MLKDKLKEDLKSAMKAGDAERTGVLRLLQASLMNKEIEKRTKTGKDEAMTDDEVLAVLATEAKKRKDSIDAFEKGGRADLAAKEKSELAVLQAYLPQQLSQAEVEKQIEAMVKKNNYADFKVAVKEVMVVLKGKADGKLITETLKKMIGQGNG